MNAQVFTSLPNYYQERGSGLQIGNLNIGPEMAKAVSDGLGGLPVAGGLAKALTTLTSTVKVKNGDHQNLVTWSRSGPDFYTDMKRTNWQGLSIHIGDAASFGVGKYMSMNPGDQYKINLNVAVFYRWQDATGEWSTWQSKTVPVATLNLSVTSDMWTTLSIDVAQNGYINWQAWT